jgi:predicted TIM-barrel fold metal-dependent hydrolase
MEGLNNIIDIHCHMVAAGGEDGFLHPKFVNSLRARAYMYNIGIFGMKQLLGVKKTLSPEEVSKAYKNKLVGDIESSSLNHVVVFALDGVYENGALDRERTEKYITNEAVIKMSEDSGKILAGCSINPLRKDWGDELEKCLEGRMALVKWLPNVMGFDPADERIIPFYERLAEEEVPLVSHVGFEYALNTIDPSYSKLEKLFLPLDIGVKVIAAHCGQEKPMFDNDKRFGKLVETVEKYPNFYMDISAMATVHRRVRLDSVLRNDSTRERLVKILLTRMCR